jgi:putative ABC transport system permease protein
MIDQLRLDLVSALRNLRRYPIATLVAVGSLAAGIGATTATLTVRNAVFINPPSTYERPAELSRVQVVRTTGASAVPAVLFWQWRDALGPSIAAAAPMRTERDVRIETRRGKAAVRPVTPELFHVLGVRPILGTTFPINDDRGGAPPIVLSHDAWRILFDTRADAIGRTVWIDDQPHIVIGVMPARFWYGEMQSPIWMRLDRRESTPDDRLDTVVRRADHVTEPMLVAQLQAGLDTYARTQPPDEGPLRLRVSGVRGTPLGEQVGYALIVVLGASVMLTLLLACANAALLIIVQWTTREHEIAIRASLGASRGRLVRALLTEAIVIAIAGGVLGVCLTFALRGWIISRGDLVSYFDLSIDPRVLGQTALVTLGAGLAAGMWPALMQTRRLQFDPLRGLVRSDRSRQRWRQTLVVFEIAVTVALLVETTAMIDGYRRAMAAQLGYATRPLLTARLDGVGRVAASEVLTRLGALPGVAAVGASTSVPFFAAGPRTPVTADPMGTSTVSIEMGAISPSFFSALGVSMRAGRAFADGESTTARTTIVNESLARRLFSDRDALGARLWIASVPHTIVGIVADYSSQPLRFGSPESRVFVPLALDAPASDRLRYLVRANGDAATLVQPVRRALREIAGDDRSPGVVTIDGIRRVIGQELIVGTAPLVPLIIVGVVMTMAGIYAVLAFSIARRSRELAVRKAIGAGEGDIARLVASHMMRLVLIGATVGAGAIVGLSRVLGASQEGGSIYDPRLPAIVVPLILMVAMGALATWLPVRRARKIDPASLLRTP